MGSGPKVFAAMEKKAGLTKGVFIDVSCCGAFTMPRCFADFLACLSLPSSLPAALSTGTSFASVCTSSS